MSPRPAEYRLTPAARNDLESIWHYSFETWGIDQANTYIDELNKAFVTLSEAPQQGVSCEHIRQTYRRYAVRHHVVYYQPATHGIKVVRVLHERMLARQHL